MAGHILNSLLDAGFKVKATVHSQQKADRLRELYPARENDLQVVVVEDIAKDGAFDEAVKGVTGVCSFYIYIYTLFGDDMVF